jgi:HK97 family phage major capsid protein
VCPEQETDMIELADAVYPDLRSFIDANYANQSEAAVLIAEAPRVKDILNALHAHQKDLVAEAHELHDNVERHDRDPLASEIRKSENLDRRIAETQRFVNAVLDIVEQRKANRERMDRERSRFNPIIRGGKTMEHSELSNWIRHGGSPTFDIETHDVEYHDLTKGGSAGAAVPLGFVGQFYMHLIASAGVRQTNAIVYRTSGGEPLVIPKSTVDPTAAIVAEGVAITPNDPTFSSVTLSANGYKALVYVSRELIEDSAIDVEEILGRLLGRAIGQANGTDLVTGTGTSKPLGVANSPVDGSVATWALLVAGATGPDLLQDLFHSINPPYRPQATWMMNDATLAALRKLKSTTNEYLVQRSLVADQPETLFGRPVVSDPNFGTGAGTGTRILFGDFSSYYAIRDVGTVRLERSDDFRFANDEVAFRAVLRTDGRQVLNDTTNAAVKALRITA